MNNIVNTRISIRNDELSNWVSSDVTLLKGELALARRPDDYSEGAGTYELRIGVGGKKWQQLNPGNFAISASQVIGLSSTVSQLSTAHYEAESLDQLSDYSKYNNGDTAVVKQLIGVKGETSSYSYTAYVFDSQLTSEQKPNGDWAAMDGNYNAANVYFDENLTYTNAIGALSAPDGGMGTISSTGMNLEDFLKTLMNKEKSGEKTDPSVTVNTTTTTVEYGSIQYPTYKFTFNHGKYEYGPDPTGTKITAWNVTTDGNSIDMTGITSDVIDNTDGAPAPNPSSLTAIFTGNSLTSNIYQISANASYSQGDVPYTNMHNEDSDASARIAAGNKSNKTYLYTVYKPTFWKVTTVSVDASTSAGQETLGLTGTITANQLNAAGWTKLNGQSKTSYQVPQGWYDIYFFAPSNWKTNWSGSDNKTHLPVNTKATETMTFTHIDNSTETYRLFRVENADAGDATTITMTFA